MITERPIEPNNESVEPEQWAAILAWTEERFEETQAENERLRKALNHYKTQFYLLTKRK